MKKVDKILFIKQGMQGGWYMEVHFEYIIRYLGGEFFIEQANIPAEPFDDFTDRTDVTPLMRNPNDYDLLIPELGTHWHLPVSYAKKVANISWDGFDGFYPGVAASGATTPILEKLYKKKGMPYCPLRLGIDTNLFQPYKMARTDDLVHIGFIGSQGNPRHQAKQILETLGDMEGTRLMFFPYLWSNTDPYNKVIGDGLIDRVVDGEKTWAGVPNLYNQMDILVRLEQLEEYGFPVLEAAACGVPFVSTDWGNCPAISDGGVIIDHTMPIEKQLAELKEGVRYLRDHPRKRKMMGKKGREEIEKNWTWDRHINKWRRFFKKGLENVRKSTSVDE